MPTHLSVAMCTYNGAAYVKEQLESIAIQQRLPDELVVCDDCSGDDTPRIVRHFAGQVPFEVRLIVNDQNVGPTANFEQAIGLCTGQIVALADQDDLWEPDKLLQICKAFESATRPALVFSDAHVTDESLNDLGYRLWDAVMLSRQQRHLFKTGRAFEALLHHNVVTGATLAFDGDYRELVTPIPAMWIHDGWIALLLSAVGPSVMTDQPLLRYRRHEGQQIGETKLRLVDQYHRARRMNQPYFQQVADNHDQVLKRLLHHRDQLTDLNLLAHLRAKIEHWRARARMRDSVWLRPALLLRELLRGRYRRYSMGWKSVAQDLLL